VPTIGVSIAIPPPYGEELQRQRAAFGDPLADSIPTHVTLLPPTEVDAEAMEEIEDHLAKVAVARDPFGMLLRGTGTFRPVSPVVFVQVAGGIAECEQLEKAVRSGPLQRELQFNYHPHVTVAHHVDEAAMDRAFAELADYQCSFRVDSFQLYEHGEDLVWRPVRTFGFDGQVEDAESGMP
jgi:2'-5' RNA ligase